MLNEPIFFLLLRSCKAHIGHLAAFRVNMGAGSHSPPVLMPPGELDAIVGRTVWI